MSSEKGHLCRTGNRGDRLKCMVGKGPRKMGEKSWIVGIQLQNKKSKGSRGRQLVK
jgi:hypothetical protein